MRNWINTRLTRRKTNRETKYQERNQNGFYFEMCNFEILHWERKQTKYIMLLKLYNVLLFVNHFHSYLQWSCDSYLSLQDKFYTFCLTDKGLGPRNCKWYDQSYITNDQQDLQLNPIFP